MSVRYVGSGPYCYANSLAMVIGDGAPDPSAIEVLTGSPFGAELIENRLPFFDPLGWDPDRGLDAAIALLGWRCVRTAGAGDAAAMAGLREAVRAEPVLVGPVEIGLLLHQPGSGTAIGSDHFVVVVDVDDERVRFHDPHGHPFATMPVDEFRAAWRADTIGYTVEPYVMRTGFQRTEAVDVRDALRRSLPAAVRWLDGRGGAGTPPPWPGGAAAVERFAGLVEAGLDDEIRGHLVYFAVRVGARRLADAAHWLAELGLGAAATIADRQARLVGGLQYDLVRENRRSAAATLRALAPTYRELSAALSAAI